MNPSKTPLASDFSLQAQAVSEFLPHAILDPALRQSLPYLTENNVSIKMPTPNLMMVAAVLSPYLSRAAHILVITPSKDLSSEIQKEFCSHNGFLVRNGFVSKSDFFRYAQPSFLIAESLTDMSAASFNLIIKSFLSPEEKIPYDSFDLIIFLGFDDWRPFLKVEVSQKIFLTSSNPFSLFLNLEAF